MKKLKLLQCLLVVIILSLVNCDRFDLTSQDINYLEQMNNYELNLQEDPSFFGAKLSVRPSEVDSIVNGNDVANMVNSNDLKTAESERKPKMFRDFVNNPESSENRTGIRATDGRGSESPKMLNVSSFSWPGPIRLPWNLTSLSSDVKLLEEEAKKLPLQLLMKVEKEVNKSPLSLKIIKEWTKSQKKKKVQKQKMNEKEFASRQLDSMNEEKLKRKEKYENRMKKYANERMDAGDDDAAKFASNWKPILPTPKPKAKDPKLDSQSSEDQFSFFPTETFNDDVDKAFFERDDFDKSFFDGKDSDSVFAKLETDFERDPNRRQDFDDEEIVKLFPENEFESSPLVGRLEEEEGNNESGRNFEDSKFFNFPSFAVAPTTSVEKTKQQQQQPYQPEPQQQFQPESQYQRQTSYSTTQSQPKQVNQQQQAKQPPNRQRQKQQLQSKQQPKSQQQEPQREQQLQEEEKVPDVEFQPPWNFFPDESGDNFFKKPDILKEKSSTKSRTSSGGRSIEQTPLIDRLDSEIDPEHRSYHNDHHYVEGRNHIKVYRGKSTPIKGHHDDDHYGGEAYFAPWGYHATLTQDAHYKHGYH